MKNSHFTKFRLLTTLTLLVLPAVLFSQSIVYTTSREKTKNHNEFAGGSACCNCNTEHYGQLPSDFPAGKVKSITFYLTASRENSYYTTIKNGPTRLTLTLGERVSAAISEKVPDGATLPVTVPWLITFKYNPPASIGPNMSWKLTDGDNNIYSAVWVHSSDVDLSHGLPGFSKVFGCKYDRVVKASYSVKFDMLLEQSLLLLTNGTLTSGKSRSFAGGSSCCGCRIDHYGTLPSNFPEREVRAVTFYLAGSRENSYYTKIKNGATRLKFTLGDRESVAMSETVAPGKKLPLEVPWFIKFVFSPPVQAKSHMAWKLLDGDNNIYSAALLHSSDLDLMNGLRGTYKTYDCQYARVEDQSYSVKFDFTSAGIPIKPDYEIVDKIDDVKGEIREKVLKTAVIEFSERGDLGIQDAGAIIAEWMTTELNKTGAFEIYERLSLEKLMEEHKLGMSGLMNEETIAQIGKMRGVQAIVTGSVIKFGDIISVTAKLIDTETAQVIDSADIKATDVNSISSQIEKLALDLAID